MKNLNQLNEILFSQLEKVTESKLSQQELSAQIEKSKAVVCLSKMIIDNARLALDVEKEKGNSIHSMSVPPMLRLK